MAVKAKCPVQGGHVRGASAPAADVGSASFVLEGQGKARTGLQLLLLCEPAVRVGAPRAVLGNGLELQLPVLLFDRFNP